MTRYGRVFAAMFFSFAVGWDQAQRWSQAESNFGPATNRHASTSPSTPILTREQRVHPSMFLCIADGLRLDDGLRIARNYGGCNPILHKKVGLQTQFIGGSRDGSSETEMHALHPDLVRDAIARSAIQKAELAKAAGLHPNSLSGIEGADWNPRWKTLERLCAAVDGIKRARA